MPNKLVTIFSFVSLLLVMAISINQSANGKTSDFNYPQDVPQDYNEALKAAQQGDALAQYGLGIMYYDGRGVPRDYKESVKWYKKAAEQGLPDAQRHLWIVYYYGQGAPQDYKEAFKWDMKLAQQEDFYAEFEISQMYYEGKGVAQDYNEGLKWLAKSAEQGYAQAQYNLGIIYYDGNNVPQDYKEAVKWYTKAAEKNHAKSQFNLCTMYYQGRGVIEDYVEAYKWSLIASMNGEDVTKLKQLLSAKMTPAQIAEAQKLAKDFVAKKENPDDSDSLRSEHRISPKSTGTCFFISPSGYMVTAAHVVENTRSIQIFSSSGKYQAKVVLLDEPTDIAILKADGAEFPYLEIISSSTVNVGDKIFTIGFPNVSVQGTEPKYTDGTISSLSGIDNNIHNFQISIPVQPGNSGSPLLSAKGDVIGIVVSRLDDIGMLETTGTVPQNVNYAAKSAFIFPLLENLPGWQSPKAKSRDETISSSETINKVRNAVALVLVY